MHLMLQSHKSQPILEPLGIPTFYKNNKWLLINKYFFFFIILIKLNLSKNLDEILVCLRTRERIFTRVPHGEYWYNGSDYMQLYILVINLPNGFSRIGMIEFKVE